MPLVRRAGVPASDGAALQGPVRIREFQPSSLLALSLIGWIYILWREGATTRTGGAPERKPPASRSPLPVGRDFLQHPGSAEPEGPGEVPSLPNVLFRYSPWGSVHLHKLF